MYLGKFCLFIKHFVTMRVGRLTSDVVLFSVVDFKTLDILQGSVATQMRCGGNPTVGYLAIVLL